MRWMLLLIASYVFYMTWNVSFIVLILISTIVDYVVAQCIYRAKIKRTKTIWLILSLCTNLGLLFYFKYFGFFIDATNALFLKTNIDIMLTSAEIILPVGISFYTFQTLSYTIDVYRGKLTPETHLGIFGLYVAYFPQLVAGPIERPSNLLPQLNNLPNIKFDYEQVTDGLKLVGWGLFKKVVIADRVAIYVNEVYATPNEYTGFIIIIAMIFFAFQIYCDFSGYSDIAIGVAKMLGVRLSQNFDRPYLSRSIPEFWQRWHITLSTWFRDYVYIPLGGNRVSKVRWIVNIMITFTVSGLWHGANWTFIIWGAIHGSIYLISSFLDSISKSFIPSLTLPAILNIVIMIIKTFTTFVIVCIAWAFFRAESIQQALIILGQALQFNSESAFELIPGTGAILDFEVYFAFSLIAFLMIVEIGAIWIDWSHQIKRSPLVIRFSLYLILGLAITILGEFTKTSEFIYFQF